MKKQQIVILIAAVLVAGGIGYFLGGHFAAPSGVTGAFQNMGPVDRAARFAQTGGARGVRTGVAGGFATGEVVRKDAQGITVKLIDGSSKIVFLASSTSITKSSKGAAGDIRVGSQVMVTGNANTDGSITARGIDIRPSGASTAPGVQ